MSVQKVRPGQVWASSDGKRRTVITSVIERFDDVHYRNAATGRDGSIFAWNLRRSYTLEAVA